MALRCTVCWPRMPADEDSGRAEDLSQPLVFWGKMKTKPSLELHPNDYL